MVATAGLVTIADATLEAAATDSHTTVLNTVHFCEHRFCLRPRPTVPVASAGEGREVPPVFDASGEPTRSSRNNTRGDFLESPALFRG